MVKIVKNWTREFTQGVKDAVAGNRPQEKQQLLDELAEMIYRQLLDELVEMIHRLKSRAHFDERKLYDRIMSAQIESLIEKTKEINL